MARSVAGGEVKSGVYVWLEVKDDGVGMDAATLAQMFDPFFTTKFVGRGLGMAAVLGIVRSHDGAIDVESRPGGGTCVRVLFPASDMEPTITAARTASSARGAGVVLVVDDEKNIRITTQLLLQTFGFEVILASDGVEALAALSADSQKKIGAVLLDQTMPRMDGTETLKELRRIAPTVPVVLSSGYGPALLHHPREAAPDAVLTKPYEPERLVATLQRLMHR